MPPLRLLGSMLDDKQPRPCGLCGETVRLSRAHVPPQVAGNTTRVLRAPSVIGSGTRRPGTRKEGGMWVRGLCYECNHRAGNLYDRAYADFAQNVARLSTPFARGMAVIPGEAPGVFFAPGLVARCVLFGMFAINLRLRLIFPELARDLLEDKDPSEGRVAWPSRVALRVGLTHPLMPHVGVLSSGVWGMRVLTERVVHFTFADIAFPPLVWSLVPLDEKASAQFGPQITNVLADASEWVHYGRGRTHVDLRWLTRDLAAIALPSLTDQSDWIETLNRSDDDASGETPKDADSVVVFGFIPESDRLC